MAKGCVMISTRIHPILISILIAVHGTAVFASTDDHLDKTLPIAIPVAPYPGERYEALVPDTLDLVDHANLAINVLTSCLAPEYDYEQYDFLDFRVNPPLLKLGGGLINLNPKWAEALPRLRVMTGSKHNLDIDGKLIGSLVHITGKDGLCYYPVENRPWAFFEEVTRKVGKPYADVFGEGRQLLAYATWYQHDRNPLWKELAERKIRRLTELALRREDTLYFRLSRGYIPGDVAEGPIVPLADSGVYPVEQGMTRTPATYICGYFPMAGFNWYHLTGNESALKLGGGLARYLQIHGKMLDENTGDPVVTDHPGHLTKSILANLVYAIGVDDREMIKWAGKGYESIVSHWDPDETGIIFGKVPCVLSHIIAAGILLSREGVANYWEEVDRWVRNSLLECQLMKPDIEGLKSMPVQIGADKNYPGRGLVHQFDDGADRVLGAWNHGLTERGWSIGCCNGNASITLYYIWDSILALEGGNLRVNLLMNRASPWADVSSHLPYEGKVSVQMKAPREEVLIRIPEWTNWNNVMCRVNGVTRNYDWSGGYINVGAAGTGDEIVVEFPMKQRKLSSNFPEVFHQVFFAGGEEYKVTLRGNTVIEMTPDMGYPISRHARYSGKTTPLKKVERFVSQERFIW
jgi:hypothetical protein